MKEFIERLEAERVKRNLSYDKLAEVAEVAKGNVYKTLTFKSEPAASTFFKIAEALGFDIIMRETVNPISTDWKEGNDLLKKKNNKASKAINNVKKLATATFKPNEEKKPSKIAETVEAIKKQNECENCKYTETKTGIRIRLSKCDDCKKLKTKK